MEDYDQQALDFLRKTKATLKIEFSHRGHHFDGDTDERDIYNITLSRGERVYIFPFGNSIADSGEYKLFIEPFGLITSKGKLSGKTHNERVAQAMGRTGKIRLYNHEFDLNKEFKRPTAYGVLACLTTHDPIDFENFCSGYGYNNDSIIAQNTYKGVQEEYNNLKMLFSDEELGQLSEIL